jgi:hypothetical protein
MKPKVKVSLCNSRWDISVSWSGGMKVGTGDSIEEAVGDVVEQILEEVEDANRNRAALLGRSGV